VSAATPPGTPPRPEDREDSRSLFALLRDLPATLLELVRIEFEQFKREMGRKLKNLGIGALLFVIAGTLGLFLMGTLCAAAILGLALIMPAWQAALVVSGAILILMIILFGVAASKFKKGNPPLPTETFDSLIEDAHALRGEGRFDHDAL
jgi:O-antigen ligase